MNLPMPPLVPDSEELSADELDGSTPPPASRRDQYSHVFSARNKRDPNSGSKLKRPRILKRRGSKVVPVATPTYHAKDWGEKCVDGFQVLKILRIVVASYFSTTTQYGQTTELLVIRSLYCPSLKPHLLTLAQYSYIAELEVEEVVAGTGMVGGTYRLLATGPSSLASYITDVDSSDEVSDIEVLDQSYEEFDIDVSKPVKLDLSMTEDYSS
ncbi:hypothetical protein RR48_00990 [Papilio machaon]|uniref:Uncharacterized protein n=1 Tax=Papilio machaon TaxID=76193 RepID=A0A0N0PC50_PAPMA|nr:hypothetical protein RR48_00990 [Papilio machaon]